MVDFCVDDKPAMAKMKELIEMKDRWIQRLEKATNEGDNEKVRQALYHIKSCETGIDRLMAEKAAYMN